MKIDDILTLCITIIIIIMLVSGVRFHIINQKMIHFIVLVSIVFLFYIKYEKSSFMVSLLYLFTFIQSYKAKEYFEDQKPSHSLDNTLYPEDKQLKELLTKNNLPSQIIAWYSISSFDDKPPVQWRDLARSNHIYFTSSSAAKINISSNSSGKGPNKWVSGDINTQLSIPFTIKNDGITFVHLTRYNPRSSNRGKLWTNENGTWVSGYNDNNFTFTNVDGTELTIVDSDDKNGDIMNIRGSNWNLIIDQMDIKNSTRIVMVNGKDYVFKNSMKSIPDKIGLNIHSGNKSDWDCAEIMIYYRILNNDEIQQILNYINKKYLMKYDAKITEAHDYNIYNRFTFSSIPENDWQLTQAKLIRPNGNELMGITDSEYDCVKLCQTNSCVAFSYHMEKGTCYSVNEKDILNHNTPNKATISGTRKSTEIIAKTRKELEERKAKEEADRKAAAAKAAAAKAAADAEAAKQAKRLEDERAQAQAQAQAAKRVLATNNNALPWFNKQYFVYVHHKPELNISNGDFCIECWYYEHSATGNNTIVDKGDYSFLFQVRPNGQQSIGFYNRSTGWWYSPGSIPSKQWVHLAINYSQWNRTMTFYMNGNFVSSHTFRNNFTATNGLMNIGRQSPDSCSCNVLNNAAIFDLRLWNWFRSQYQIQTNMRTKISPNSTGLVANYMMTYRSDLVVYDETNRNHGRFIASSWWYNPNDIYRKIQLPYSHDDIPYDSRRRCPTNYNAPTADRINRCYSGWSNSNREENAKSNCAYARGTWVQPLDYRYNAYTCQMNEHLPKP